MGTEENHLYKVILVDAQIDTDVTIHTNTILPNVWMLSALLHEDNGQHLCM